MDVKTEIKSLTLIQGELIKTNEHKIYVREPNGVWWWSVDGSSDFHRALYSTRSRMEKLYEEFMGKK